MFLGQGRPVGGGAGAPRGVVVVTLGRLAAYAFVAVLIVAAAPLVVLVGLVQIGRRRYLSGALLVLAGATVVWLAWPAYMGVLGPDDVPPVDGEVAPEARAV